MKLLNISEHLNCIHYDMRKKMDIEVKELQKGHTEIVITETDEVVFIRKGFLKYKLDDLMDFELKSNKLFFLARSGEYSFFLEENTEVVIFRINNLNMLCKNYQVKDMLELVKSKKEEVTKQKDGYYSSLNVNSRLSHFFKGIFDCIGDGLKCRNFFDFKIKELLILLRTYYTKEELYSFFSPMLNNDFSFSDYVSEHWQKFSSIKEFAHSMRMTQKQFYNKFKSNFAQTPHRWMMEAKADIIYKEITTTDKQFKEIAIEQNFPSESQFTRFCKTMFQFTPSEIRMNHFQQK